jgi:hypothetical protein
MGSLMFSLTTDIEDMWLFLEMEFDGTDMRGLEWNNETMEEWVSRWGRG